MPFIRSRVAQVCLRSWNLMSGSPARLRSGFQYLSCRVSRRMGVPRRVQRHYVIGRAQDVDTRVRELSSSSPMPVELEHAFPCEGSVEAQLSLQKMYTEYRT